MDRAGSQCLARGWSGPELTFTNECSFSCLLWLISYATSPAWPGQQAGANALVRQLELHHFVTGAAVCGCLLWMRVEQLPLELICALRLRDQYQRWYCGRRSQRLCSAAGPPLSGTLCSRIEVEVAWFHLWQRIYPHSRLKFPRVSFLMLRTRPLTPGSMRDNESLPGLSASV